MDLSGLWRVASKVNSESFLQAQLETAGSQRARLLERLEKNLRSARHNQHVITIVSTTFVGVLCILPALGVMSFLQQSQNAANAELLLFSLALSMTFYHALVLVFMVVYKLTFFGSFMTGDAFRYISTLPVTQQDLGRLAFISFIKLNLPEIITTICTYPVILIVLGAPIQIILVGFCTNMLSVSFVLDLAIIAGNFLARKILKSGDASKSNTIFRVLFFAGYMVVAMFFSIIIQVLMKFTADLFSSPIVSNELASNLNAFLPLIFFPFAPSYLVAMCGFSPGMLGVPSWLAIIMGSVLFVLVTWRLTRRALRILAGLGSQEPPGGPARVHVSPIEVVVNVKAPVTALTRKCFLNITREISSLLFFMMAFFFPVIGIISMSFGSAHMHLLEFFIMSNIYTGAIPFIIHMAISSADEQIGGLFVSLPLRAFDVFKARARVMYITQALGLLVPTVLMAGIRPVETLDILMVQSITGAFFAVTTPTFLLFYALMFGRLNNRWTLFMVEPRLKPFKYAGLLIISYAALIFMLTIGIMLWIYHSIQIAALVAWAIAGSIALVIVLVSRRILQ